MLSSLYTVKMKRERKNYWNRLFLFPKLRERKDQIAGSLSGGRAADGRYGRGLMSDPNWLALDEPSQALPDYCI